MNEQRTAVLLGATGLIGTELLKILLESNHYSSITIIVRTKLPISHPKLKQLEIDFNQLSEYLSHFQVTDVFSCLGTTIKKAKTKDNFRKVDYEYTLKAAEMAAKFDANFLTVTALGANPNSLFFYNRVKGDVERDLGKLPLSTVHIFQPSLLLGDRIEYRFGEKFAESVGAKLSFIFSGSLRKYKPIEGKRVAQSMVKVALQNKRGFFIHPSDGI